MARLFEMVGRFERGYPDIPLDAGLVESLTADDPKPMFVTVPIAQVGATSRNGRTYNREAVARIVQQVNSKRVVGEAGHLRDEDRPYSWGASPIRWLGAVLDESNKAWGKFYVLPSFEQIRDHIRVAMASNAQIGTSIYGTASLSEDGEVMADSLELESIDLAHPDRLGLPELATAPTITRETYEEENEDSEPIEEGNMPEPTPQNEAVVSELRQANDRLNERVRDLEVVEEQHRQLQRDVATIRQRLNISGDADAVREIQRIQNENADMRTRLAELVSTEVRLQVAESVEVEDARAFVVEQMELVLDTDELPGRDEIAETLKAVMARPTVKDYLRRVAMESVGPNMTQPNHRNKKDEGNSEPLIIIPTE